MKNKNLALIAALSFSFMTAGLSTAHAASDDLVKYESEDPSQEEAIFAEDDYDIEEISLAEDDYGIEELTMADDEKVYGEDDIPSLEKDVNDLIKQFEDLQKQIKGIEEDGVTKPTAEEKAIAKAQWDKGAIGFYEANGSYEAIEVFKSIPAQNGVNYDPSTGPVYLNINRLGSKIDDNDSRNLDNMKVSIESLREINAKRQSDGGIDGKTLSVFGISDFDMAVAQANANFSSQHMSHSSVYGPPFENLAWSYNDPSAQKAIDQWWNSEKPVFDYLRAKGLKTRTEMEDYIARNKSAMKAKFGNPQVGHYLNLVDDLSWGNYWSPKDAISMGYALKKTGVYPFTKSLVRNPSAPTNRTVYSIDDYEARFLAYYTELNNIVNLDIKTVDENAMAEANKLKKEADALKKEIDVKKEVLNKLYKESKDREEYTNLQKAIERNRVVIEAAQFLLDFAPQKVANVRPQLLQIIEESNKYVRMGEKLLIKKGYTVI